MTFSMIYYDIYDFTFFISIGDDQKVHGGISGLDSTREEKKNQIKALVLDVTQTNAIIFAK